MDPLIHLPYTLGEVEDPYLVGLLDIVIDILHVLFEYTIVILSHWIYKMETEVELNDVISILSNNINTASVQTICLFKGL